MRSCKGKREKRGQNEDSQSKVAKVYAILSAVKMKLIELKNEVVPLTGVEPVRQFPVEGF